MNLTLTWHVDNRGHCAATLMTVSPRFPRQFYVQVEFTIAATERTRYIIYFALPVSSFLSLAINQYFWTYFPAWSQHPQSLGPTAILSIQRRPVYFGVSITDDGIESLRLKGLHLRMQEVPFSVEQASENARRTRSDSGQYDYLVYQNWQIMIRRGRQFLF